jgi:hypothetical protein
MAPRRLQLVGAVLACGLACSLALAPAAAAEPTAPPTTVTGRIVTDKQPHPADRDVEHRGAPVPCGDPRASFTVTPGWAVVHPDSTSGAGSVDSYACEPWNESGPEHVFLLEVAERLVLDIWLDGNQPDLDLVLLTDCDSDSCLVQANTEISAELGAGDYVLVVDGYQGAAGAYELALEARSVGIPDEVCEGSDTQDLGTFVGGDGPAPIVASLFQQPNLVSVYGCSPVAVRGGERWYAFTMAAADSTYDDGTDIGAVRLDFAVEPGVNAGALDLACWVFDGCGPDAVCLAFADQAASGGGEQISLRNDLFTEVTYYLAIDCLGAPLTETSGEFELSTTSTVPVSVRSLGDVKALFR